MLPHNLFEAARKANICKFACAFLRKGLVICQHFARYTFTVLFSAELGLRFAAGGQVFMALKQCGAHPSPCVGDFIQICSHGAFSHMFGFGMFWTFASFFGMRFHAFAFLCTCWATLIRILSFSCFDYEHF